MEPGFFLVTYDPLIASPAGREAVEEFGLPPFIDGSIRREPDLEHEYPSISCLCRAGQFAPRLKVGNFVAYMTKKRDNGHGRREQRLTAILRVDQVFESHSEAAAWYRGQGFSLPSNCMVPGNAPKPLEQSHRLFGACGCASKAREHREWDAEYRRRAGEHQAFVACEKLWSDLSCTAPAVEVEDLIAAFGFRPGTRTPGKHSPNALKKLMKRFRIPLSTLDA